MSEVPSADKPHDGVSSAESTLLHVQQHWSTIRSKSPVYAFFFSDIQIVSAQQAEGRIIAHLPLSTNHINSKGILHGSVSATLIDWAGGMAIAAATGRDRTGVSTDIHVSYVSAAREGERLEIEAWVNRAGKTLAYTTVEIRKAVDGGTKGPVVAAGSHTKYLAI